MARLVDIPAPMPDSLIIPRLSSLVSYRTTSMGSPDQTPETPGQFYALYDKVHKFAKEDAGEKPIYFKTGEIKGRPWMVLSNHSIPPDFGSKGMNPFHADLAFFIHADTHKAGSESQYELQIDGPWLRGKGVLDQKSGFLPAISAVVNAPSNLNVVAVGYPDEENMSVVFPELFNRGFSTDIALQTDGAPVPEGYSNISFVPTGKFTHRSYVELIDGPLDPAHSSRSHLSPSALEHYAIPFMLQVRLPVEEGGAGIPHPYQREPYKTTVVFKVDDSDKQHGTTNSDIRLYMELRLLNHKNRDEALQRIRAIAARNGLRVDPFYEGKPYFQDPKAAPVELYRSIGYDVMRREMDNLGDTGGNDFGKIPEEHNTTTIQSGLAGGGSHGPDEWLLFEALQQSIQVQTVFAQELPSLRM